MPPKRKYVRKNKNSPTAGEDNAIITEGSQAMESQTTEAQKASRKRWTEGEIKDIADFIVKEHQCGTLNVFFG